MIAFNKNFKCNYGRAEQIAPQIRRVVANNPSPFTFYGTGTYIVGEGSVAIIDPGPNSEDHIEVVLSSVSNEKVTHILVTHTHLDHSPGCRILRRFIDAPTYGFGPHGSGRILKGEVVEEGADKEFVPDIKVNHGDIVSGEGWSFECVHTPGHTSNHVCYQLREQKMLFCGDHVMAWSTSIIAPPDGNLTDYIRSLDLLLERDDKTYWPCHGPSIGDPKPFVRSYLEHRHRRIEQVLTCLKSGIDSIQEMLPVIYTELPKSMYPAAARSILSTLIYLVETHQVTTESLTLDSTYRFS